MTEREEVLEVLYNYPAEYGRAVGYTDLKDTIHNDWIKETVWCVTHGIPYNRFAHRISFKTTCLMIGIAIVMQTHPWVRMGLFRKNDERVKEFTRGLREILLHPRTQYYAQVLYGRQLKFDIDNYSELNLNISLTIGGDSQFYAMGIKGSVTGSHKDYYFTDDVVAEEDRYSNAEREKTIRFYKELYNLANTVKGQTHKPIANQGTPWHMEDLYNHPQRYIGDWKFLTPYDTGLLTEDQLEEIKRVQGLSLYSAGYFGEMVADENKEFKDPVILSQEESVPSLLYDGIGHIDARYSGKHYTAFTIIKVNKQAGRIYAFGKVWYKHVNDCMDEIERWWRYFRCGTIWNETNADKGWVDDELKARKILHASYSEKENKHNKIVTYLRKNWPNISFLKQTETEAQKEKKIAESKAEPYLGYIYQICEYEEGIEPDDAPDSLSSNIRQYRKKPKVSPVMGDKRASEMKGR